MPELVNGALDGGGRRCTPREGRTQEVLRL